MIQTAHFSDIDAIFTDLDPKEDIKNKAKEYKVSIYVAD